VRAIESKYQQIFMTDWSQLYEQRKKRVKLRDDEKVKHIPITIMPTEKAEMLRKPAWIKIKLPRNTDKN
jgi:hypothetical protein